MILFYSEISFNLTQKLLYKKWLTFLIHNERRKLGSINYIFCDDAYLLELNQKYLQHDTLTDIITFDYTEEKTISGDIYISIERVRENSSIFGVTFQEELLRVLSHGVMHLCGYKDKTETDAAMMRTKENFAIERYHQIVGCCKK